MVVSYITRMIATVAIWLFGMVGFVVLVSSLSRPFTPDGLVASLTTLIIGLLAFTLLLVMFITSRSVWQQAGTQQQTSARMNDHAAETARKHKRDQQERVRRLLERMDADDLAALENGLTVGADGEVVSLEEVLKAQRR